MKDLERVLYYAIDRKNDCKKLEDICKKLEDISCFSDEFKAQLLGMKEAYNDIVNYIYLLLHLEPENTGDKEPEDKKQNTFTKDGQEYTDLNKPINHNLTYAKIRNCEECSFYKEFLSQGKVYVGDSPCTWCSLSQVTCSTNTQEQEFYSKKEDK